MISYPTISIHNELIIRSTFFAIPHQYHYHHHHHRQPMQFNLEDRKSALFDKYHADSITLQCFYHHPPNYSCSYNWLEYYIYWVASMKIAQFMLFKLLKYKHGFGNACTQSQVYHIYTAKLVPSNPKFNNRKKQVIF